MVRRLLLLLLARCWPACLADEEATFSLGIFGALTAGNPEAFAAAVAFDLDFRKNYDEDVRNRLGPPIINVSNLNSRLRIRPYIGTSHGSPALGVRTTLDWFLGSANVSTVVGIVGGSFSAVSIPVSSNAAVFQVPMISYQATSPALSDKAEHPYFMRTCAPDTLRASAQWAWTAFFGIPSIAYVYGKEPFAEGLFGAFLNLAIDAGQSYRVLGVPVDYDPTGLELEPCTDAMNRLHDAGTRFGVILLLAAQINTCLYALELQWSIDMYQWMAADPTLPLVQHPYVPSRMPLGMQAYTQIYQGPKFREFAYLWSNLTVNALNGTDAQKRYRLNDMQAPLGDSLGGLLTSAGSADLETIDNTATFLFDAAYAFVFAINALLNNGTDPAEIKGQKLLDELRKVSFDGASSPVAFDAAGDGIGSYILENLQTDSWIVIGNYDSATSELALEANPMWADGTQSPSPPLWMFECPDGFEKSRQTSVCEPCRKGIACGYQPEVGFPLGILGPMTSVSQSYLAAAALFDLDFRKNSDQQLRERFGPPIFNITNLDPRLRFKVQIGTSNSQPEVGVNSGLDWLQGNGDFHRVVGIVGGYHSAVSTPVSSLAAVFEVPVVSWASSSPALSDKSTHPYFSRTAPSDVIQGSAIWAWITSFGFPSAAFFYTMEPYGAGIYGFVNDLATSQNLLSRIHGIAVEHQPSSYDTQVALDACQRIRETGSKLIVLAMSAVEANAAMRVMELEDMLYGGFQVFGSESVSYVSHADSKPSNGLPIGLQLFQPETKGLLYPAFQEMWKQLTLDDVYGSDAVARYMLDSMQVLLPDAAAPTLKTTDFGELDDGIGLWASFLVDAAYTYVIAINNLLLKGTEPQDIYGSLLLNEIRQTEFEGVSGFVQFDDFGDRPTKFGLWNIQPTAPGSNGTAERNSSVGNPFLTLVEVAFFDSSTESLVFYDNASIYWAGGIKSATAPEELLACNPGFEWDLDLEVCSPCPLGWFSAGGRSACQACAPGTTMSRASGLGSSCTACEAGHFSAYGDPNCTSCPEGSFAASEGQSMCDACAVGSFGQQGGLTECTTCSGERVTTMVVVEVAGAMEYVYTAGATSNSSCGCDRGARPDAAGKCVACGEGLICKGLDGVSIQQGFYSEADLSVYRCYGDDRRCVGGEPGRTCAQGREGIACAECQNGMRPADDGICVDCESTDFLNSIIVGLLVLVVLIFAYLTIDRQNRAAQSHGFVLCAIAGGQFITVTQILSVVNMMALELESPFQNIMEGLGALTFNVGLLRMSCLGASHPVAKYTAKIAMIYLAIAGTLAMHGFFVVLLHGGAFKARMPTLYGCIGTICILFYISVTSSVLEPLQCLQHPNGKWTMRAHTSVRCWETDDHTKMAMLGLFAFVTVPVAVSAAISLIVVQYPSRMNAGDANFLKSFSFLFFRYQPKKYWFVLVQFMRSLLVALMLLIPEVTIQVVLLQLVLLACLLLTLRSLPWRGVHANVLDVVCGAMMLMMLCVTAQFIDNKDKQGDLMAFLGAGGIVALVSAILVALAYGIYCRFGPRSKPYDFFLCHHKAGAGAFARLLKLVLVDTHKLKASVFIDSDDLERLDDLFGFVCNDTANLLILASREVFTRPWCVGEMCTAKLATVHTAVVAMPDMELPDAVFIEQLTERVSNMEILTESGMALEMIRETMRWVGGLPQFALPVPLTVSRLDRFARSLISREQHPPALMTSKSNADFSKAAVIVHDTESTEAVSSALVLLKMLMRCMAAGSRHIPRLLESTEDVPTTIEACVIMCTAACLHRYNFLQALLQIQTNAIQGRMIPVLAEALFRVPGTEQLQSWTERPPAAGLSSQEATELAEAVHKLFKGIAVTFQPHHASETVLMVGAQQVARRLQATGHSTHTKETKDMMEASTTLASTAVNLVEDEGDLLEPTTADGWVVMGV